MNTDVNAEINRSSVGAIALSVLMILAGILAIIAPEVSGIAVTIFTGWLLVFSGGAHLVYDWGKRGGGHRLWEILLGIIYIVAGWYLLRHPMAGLATLTLALAVYLFLESILALILSLQLRRLRGSGWLLFDAIITLIIAIMVWRTWPISALWVMGTLVGISMLFSGFTRLMITLASRHMESALMEKTA